jgi:hypoxanthine phosphoribosyltransferase
MDLSPQKSEATWAEDVGEVLLTQEQIQKRVAELAAKLTEDYAGSQPLLVGVLTGAVVFLSDLIRYMQMPVCIDFVQLRSYGDRTVSSGNVEIVKDLSQPVAGRDVVIVEDIVDTGRTLAYLVEELRRRGARSVRTCALLDKRERREVEVQVDYVGFGIPDAFVVGYGLDFAQRYRNLPYVAVLRPEAYQTRSD